jgi:hypothetical protein
MASAQRSLVLRQTLIVILFLGIVGIFFVVNQFYFIPHEQQTYNQKVLRILQEVADDFKRRVDAQADTFAKKNVVNGNTTARPANKVLAAKDSSQALFQSFHDLDTGYLRRQSKAKGLSLAYTFKPDTILVSWFGQHKPFGDTATLSIQDALEPTIEDLHKDLFDQVMLVKKDVDSAKNPPIRNRLLYNSGQLASSSLFLSDTLNKILTAYQFSIIRDIPAAGTNYKAFVLPFRFSNQDLVLIGLVNQKSYRINTTSYSRPTMLTVLFLVLVLLLGLPLIKLYLSSRQERITTNDLRRLMVVFTAMPLLMLIVAGTILTYWQIDKKTDNDLRELHQQVEQKFTGEIRAALDQLKAYGTLLTSEDSLRRQDSMNRARLDTTNSGASRQDYLLYPSKYPYAEDVYWINDSGMQVAKWYFNPISKPYYFNVLKRDYFIKLKNHEGFLLDKDTFYIEPTISWSSGKYSINITTTTRQRFLNPYGKSGITQAIVVGLDSYMYSVVNPVVPKGYSFGIINERGDILFHSETERSLHENLFKETNENNDVTNAVRKKDPSFLPDVQLFDRNVKMLITPLDGMPSYFLVSYYTKREQNLFVFHVSAFTLLCTSLTLFCTLIFVLLYYFFGTDASARSIYTYDSAWIRPTKSKDRFYQQNIIQQVCIVFLCLVFLLITKLAGDDPYWYLLQVSLLLPFFIATSYILRRTRFLLEEKGKKELAAKSSSESSTTEADDKGAADKNNRQVNKGGLKKLGAFLSQNKRELIIYFFSVLFILFTVNLLHNNPTGFHPVPVFSIVTLCLLVPLITPFVTTFWQSQSSVFSKDYIVNYTALIFLSTFSISVLTAMGVYSFALSEEKQVRTKAEQFDLAQKIEVKRDSLNSYLQTAGLKRRDTGYVMESKFSADRGIYLLHNSLGQINPKQDSAMFKPDSLPLIRHSAFYQAVTRFLFLPKDHADFFDNTQTYYWFKDTAKKRKDSSDIVFVYQNERDHLTPASLIIQHSKEASSLLAGLFNSYDGWLIILFIAAFFVFHIMLIQTVTRKVFLLDFFRFDSTNAFEQDWVNQRYEKLSLSESDKKFLKIGSGKLNNTIIRNIEDGEESSATADKEDIKAQPHTAEQNTEEQHFIDEMTREERILHVQCLLTPAYDVIWQRLKPEERYVLYDFALDGFTNFRNIDIIYKLYRRGLIEKKDEQLELMNHSFRSYLLGKAGTQEISNLEGQFNSGSTWKNLRNVFIILLLAIVIFIFATQQDISNRILVIVSGLATLIPGLLKIFDQNIFGSGGQSAAKK